MTSPQRTYLLHSGTFTYLTIFEDGLLIADITVVPHLTNKPPTLRVLVIDRPHYLKEYTLGKINEHWAIVTREEAVECILNKMGGI